MDFKVDNAKTVKIDNTKIIKYLIRKRYSRIKDFSDRHIWISRICCYLLIFIVTLSVFKGVQCFFDYTNPNFCSLVNPAFTQYNNTQLAKMGFFDNERYFISALVQSLATTIALVITLSLVAVQLVSQSYSSRTIELYKKNPDMWILLCTYIIVIFYGLGLIKVIEIGVNGINLEFAVYFAYFLGFFAFICLIPYIWNTLESLKPTRIIRLLSLKITKKNILKARNNDGKITESNPFQPILDIINIALDRNDFETVKNGILTIRDSITYIFEQEYFEEFEDGRISSFAIENLKLIELRCINSGFETPLIVIISIVEDIRRVTVKNELEWAELDLNSFYEELELKILGLKLETSTFAIIDICKNRGIDSVKNESYLRMYETVNRLNDIAITATNENMEVAASAAIRALEEVGIKVISNQKDYGYLLDIVYKIENIGKKAIEMNRETTARTSAESIGNIGIQELGTIHEWFIENLIEILHIIGMQSIDHNMKWVIKSTANSLGTLGIGLIEIENEPHIQKIIDTLYEIECKNIENSKDTPNVSFGAATDKIREIGEKAATKERDKFIIRIAEIFEILAIKSIEKNIPMYYISIIKQIERGAIKAAENGHIETTIEYEKVLQKLMKNYIKNDNIRISTIFKQTLQRIQDAKNTISKEDI